MTSIIFTGGVTIQGFPRTQVKVVFLESSIRKQNMVMVAGLEMVNATLSKTIHTATTGRLDISDLPGLGQLHCSRLGLAIATTRTYLPSDVTLLKTLSKLRKLKQGVLFSFDHRVGGRVNQLQLAVTKRTNFVMTTTSPVSLGDIVASLFPPLSTDPAFTSLSQVIHGVFDLAVSGLDYNGAKKTFTIASILNKLTILPGYVELKKLEVVGSITSHQKSRTTFSFTLGGDGTKFNFLGFSLRASIAYNGASRRYSITLTTADSDRVSLADFTKKISPLNLDNNPVATALNLDSVAISKPEFHLASSGRGYALR